MNVVGVDETVKLGSDKEQLTPAIDEESQLKLTVPVNPPVPYNSQLRVSVGGV